MTVCTFLGMFNFPDGTCAQWFSGSASTAAVIVALGAHFYSARRQNKAERRNDRAEVASLSLLLRNLVNEADANTELIYSDCKELNLFGNSYILGRPPAGVKANSIPLLNKGQAEILIREGYAEFAAGLDAHIGNMNLTNIGIEEFSKVRNEFSPLIHRYVNGVDPKSIDQTSDEFRWFISRLKVVSSSTQHFLSMTKDNYENSLELAREFNSLCEKRSAYRGYAVGINKAERRIESLKITKIVDEQ